MDFKDIPLPDLIKSLEPEVAKAMSEVRHAQDDLDKATSRLRFILAAIHALKDRYKGNNCAD